MADYWISFRVTGQGAPYLKRYNALIEAIKQNSTLLWDADTSMVAARSSLSIDQFGQILKKTLNSTDDHLVMRYIGYKHVRYVNNPGSGFHEFFPEAKKL